MKPSDRVADTFKRSSDTLLEAMESLPDAVGRAAEAIAQCLLGEGKLLICGNGGSAADAQHMSAELLNRFMMERPGLPAIAMTTDASTITSISNDYTFDNIFSRQVTALGKEGDILLGITTSGNSINVGNAIGAAHQKNMRCIVLNGRDGGSISPMLKARDIDILCPGGSTPRIQEVHGVVIHCLCDLVDRQLFSQSDQ